MTAWLDRWLHRKAAQRKPAAGLPLIYAFDGFLSAGSSASLAIAQMTAGDGVVEHEFDLDAIYDYRARRPTIVFHKYRFGDYEAPRLVITRERDLGGREFFVLRGPEPDFGWESFVAEALDTFDRLGVGLVVGIGAIPMGVPHTRPSPITAHGTSAGLVDSHHMWDAEVSMPSSVQSLLEFRAGERGRDAIGYVVHVPHYLAQVQFPPAALALLDALTVRLGLRFDVEELRAELPDTMARIEEQIAEQGGEAVLAGLEEQYDAFARGAAKSMLEDESLLPSGDELAAQLENYLGWRRDDNDPES